MSETPAPESFARYARQIRYVPLGEAGQQRLAASKVLVCGCGALGSVLADSLVRAGVGHVRIVDRDFVELTNLQRQILFDEDDVAQNLPKAVAAANKLRRINSQVEIEPLVVDVRPDNIHALAADVDLIVDGTDNFETRFLLNDFSLSANIPWVYGGCLGAQGQTMTILPSESACLRCLMPEPPPVGATPTCDTAGILGPIVNVIASLQACEALKILSGNRAAVSPNLTVVDLWENRVRHISLKSLREAGDCPACKKHEFPWLAGERASYSSVLCGRNAVQIHPGDTGPISLDELQAKLSQLGPVSRNPYLLRATIDEYVITLFADGRAIVFGTDEPTVARSVLAKYVGV
jgi:adenylyltransferase/sulfurtransferase